MTNSEFRTDLPPADFPDEAERKRVAQERADKAKAEAFRVQALSLAVQWASAPNWSGSSSGIVAGAQVFEHYLSTGAPMGPMAYAEVYQAAKDATDASRG